MRVSFVRSAAIALVASVGLAGCAYGPYGGLGVGVGTGYGGYGGYGGYYDPYYGGGYSPYGYGYGDSYYGWNDGYYYPGTGYYVYDQYRNPYRWSDAQRRYWQDRWYRYRSVNRTETPKTVWTDFSRNRSTSRIVTNDSGQVRTESVTVAPQRVRTRHTVRVRTSDDNSRSDNRRSGRAKVRVRDRDDD